MRILWFTSRDIRNRRAGGAERATFELARRLVLLGHSVEWYTGQGEGLPPIEMLQGILIRRFPGWFLPRAACGVVTLTRAHGSVLVNDLGHVIPWPSPLLGKSNGVAVFHHLHARTLDGQVGKRQAAILRQIERLYPRLYDGWRFVVPSIASASDLVGLGVPSRQILRVPLGVDSSRFAPVAKTPDPQMIYFAGLRRYKRPTDAIQLVAKMRDQGRQVRLLVLGEGPELGACVKLADGLRVAQQVSFVGRVDERTLATLIGSSWVNIHCSVGEGFGLSVLEAAAAGTPTVAYDVPALTEVIRHGSTGFVVPWGDISALASRSLEVMDRPASWTPACRASSLSFTWDRAASLWDRLVQEDTCQA